MPSDAFATSPTLAALRKPMVLDADPVPPPTEAGPPRRQPWLRSLDRVSTLSLLLAYGFCLVVAAALWDARRDAWDRATEAAQNIRELVAHDLARNLEFIDLSLRGGAEQFNQPELAALPQALRERLMVERAMTARHIGGILLFDERANLIGDSRVATPRPVNLRFRDYFTAHRDRPDVGLYISRPFVGSQSREWTLVASRRLSRPDGSFAGVIAAVVRLSYFRELLAGMQLGSDQQVTVLRDDDVVLMREPFDEALLGRELAELSPAAPGQAAVVVAPSALDGQLQLQVSGPVPGQPLTVVVAWPVRDVMAAWWRKAILIGLATLALAAGVVWLTVVWRRDLYRRRSAEARAQAAAAAASLSEAEFRLLAENSSDMVTRLSLDLVRLYASPAAERVLGRSAADVTGQRTVDVMHPDDRDAVTRAMAELRRSGAAEATLTYRVLQPAPTADEPSREHWVEGNVRLTRDPVSGAPDGFVVISRDITERRLLELEREAQARELRTANERLSRLTQELAVARDGAEGANRAKSSFLSAMSHELRTPLNVILGFAQVMELEGGLNPRQTERVSAMLDAGRHLLEMISGILSLSQIESGQIELKAEPIEVAQVTRLCAELVRSGAEAKGLAVHDFVAADAPRRLLADAVRLRQILLNLLGNAVKFTATGSVELNVMRASTGAAPPRLRFEVVDTGPGIPAHLRHRLFHDFERLDAAEAGAASAHLAPGPAAGGSGLGLAIADRLAKLMGGEVGHADNPGGGSIFWLELPLAPETPLAAVPSPPATAPISGWRVLVADDVAANRGVAEVFLRTAGHAVTTASDGEQAVALAAAEDFDVVLMDIRMPLLDGIDATRRIRALPGQRGKVPIIALSAGAMGEERDACRLAGMDEYLTKPLSQPALLGAIGALLAARQAMLLKA